MWVSWLAALQVPAPLCASVSPHEHEDPSPPPPAQPQGVRTVAPLSLQAVGQETEEMGSSYRRRSNQSEQSLTPNSQSGEHPAPHSQSVSLAFRESGKRWATLEGDWLGGSQ